MNNYAQHLVRLADLLSTCASVVRDIVNECDFGVEAGNLAQIVGALEGLSVEVKRIGLSGLPL